MRIPVLVTSEVAADPQSSSVLGRVVLYGLVGLLLFLPLAFGAVEPWSTFTLEAGAALLFVVWAYWQAASGELRVKGGPLFLPMLVFAALIGVQLATGLTSYRYQTGSQAELYCAYGVLCFLAVQSLRRTSQVKFLAQLFTAYGFALASFALIQGIDSNGKLYWLRTPRDGGWIYGPYVNHNHYAGPWRCSSPSRWWLRFSIPCRTHEGPGRRGRGGDGHHDFSFRIARRHGGFCRTGGDSRRPADQTS